MSMFDDFYNSKWVGLLKVNRHADGGYTSSFGLSFGQKVCKYIFKLYWICRTQWSMIINN